MYKKNSQGNLNNSFISNILFQKPLEIHSTKYVAIIVQLVFFEVTQTQQSHGFVRTKRSDSRQ